MIDKEIIDFYEKNLKKVKHGLSLIEWECLFIYRKIEGYFKIVDRVLITFLIITIVSTVLITSPFAKPSLVGSNPVLILFGTLGLICALVLIQKFSHIRLYFLFDIRRGEDKEIDFYFIFNALKNMQRFNETNNVRYLLKSKSLFYIYSECSSLLSVAGEANAFRSKNDNESFGTWKNRFYFPYYNEDFIHMSKYLIAIDSIYDNFNKKNADKISIFLTKLVNLEYINQTQRMNSIGKNKIINEICDFIKQEKHLFVNHVINDKRNNLPTREVLFLLREIFDRQTNSHNPLEVIFAWYIVIQFFSLIVFTFFSVIFNLKPDTEIIGTLIGIPIAAAVSMAFFYPKTREAK